MEDIKLTQAERLILANQFAILEKLDPDDKIRHRNAKKIVTAGYEFLYGEINTQIQPPVSRSISDELTSILNMFSAIHLSADLLEKKPADFGLEFKGFNAKTEQPFYALAKFLRRELGWLPDLHEFSDGTREAEHLPRYREMLARWTAMGRKREMSAEELVTLRR